MRRVANPPNPWSPTTVELYGEPPPAQLRVHEEEARSILSRNESPDLSFRWSVNPYRGCTHGCAYCYARPTHEYLGLGAGTDFEREIVVKVNAPELLRAELGRKGWQGEAVVFSGVTDCYQPLEAHYGLTRRCLEVLLAARNPTGIVTKGALVARDVDLLRRLCDVAAVRVYVSIACLDDDEGRALEPWVARPSQRFAAMRLLAEAGIPVGLALAPLIPGLNDHAIPELLERARQNGARRAFLTMLRLPGSVLPVFRARLEETSPHRAKRVLSTIESLRDGRLDDSRFGRRFRGEGPRWQVIERLFTTVCRKLGLETSRIAEELPPRRGPQQGQLFV